MTQPRSDGSTRTDSPHLLQRRAAPLVLGALCCLALVPGLEGQQRRGRCNGEAPDPAWLNTAPVYRDCEVDRRAELRGGGTRINFTPGGGLLPTKECYRAELEFVVDESGSLELHTVRPRAGNDPDMEQAMRKVLPTLQYQPALLAGEPVRQLVVYTQAVSLGVRVSNTSGQPTSLSTLPPRC